MAVAIIEPLGGRCGLDHYDAGLCRGLLDAGVKVSLYTCDETVDPGIPGLNFQTPYVSIFGGDPAWLRGLRYVRGTVRAFFDAVRRGERVCHFHFFHGSARELVLVLIAKVLLRRVVITVHDVETFDGTSRVDGGRVGRIYGLADRMIVHNRLSEAELTNKLGVSPRKVALIPHGDYPDSAARLPTAVTAREQLGIASGARVVLFFGQIKEVKGLDVLIRAMAQVIAGVPEVVFVIAGRPWKNDFSVYDRLIDASGARKNTLLHIRFIDDLELPMLYGAADLVVLPYRKIYQSGVLLLTMSFGRAAVVSDLPGMLETVRDGVTGYVFPDGDSDALAEVLIRGLRNSEEREAIARQALAYVRENHGWTNIGQMTESVYRAASM